MEKELKRKLHKLFFVTADARKSDQGKEEFHFMTAEIFSNPSFDKFLDMIDAGEIMYDIRMGSYKSGSNKGKPHDHGSGFRIREKDIVKLYSDKEVVK